MSFTKDEDILYVATKMFKIHCVEKKPVVYYTITFL